MESCRPGPTDDIELGRESFWHRSREERAAAFARLRRERPVAHFDIEVPEAWRALAQSGGFWAVTRYADIVEVSRQPEVFSSAAGTTTLLDLPPQLLEFFGSFINMDDPRHMRLRKLVSPAFGPRCLKRFEAYARTALVETLDAIVEKGECDFVADVAAPFPIRIICDMMGIPASERAFVFDRTNLLLGASDPEYLPEGQDAVKAVLGAGNELAELLKSLARERLQSPSDDLTSTLVHAEVDGTRLSEAELASFFILLVTTGNETTRHALSHGLEALCRHPEQRDLWQSDVPGHTEGAVEEILRWATPVIFMRRTTIQAAEIAGQQIRAGEKVVLYYTSANRDESVFEEPDRFDIRRSPNPHIAFGAPGPHLCLGAHLARREIALVFAELFERLPDIEVCGTTERLRSHFIDGIKHLPCRFTPRASG